MKEQFHSIETMSETSESSITQIAKFDGANFAMWKMRASALLMAKGLLNVVIQHGDPPHHL